MNNVPTSLVLISFRLVYFALEAHIAERVEAVRNYELIVLEVAVVRPLSRGNIFDSCMAVMASADAAMMT